MKEPQGVQVTLRHEGQPGGLGMVTYLHGVVYARGIGLATTLEPAWRACCPISDAGWLWPAS